MREGLPALRAQGLGAVQHFGDAALFGAGWEGNLEVVEMFISKVIDVRACRQRRHTLPIRASLEEVREVGRINLGRWPQDFAERAKAAFEIGSYTNRLANHCNASARCRNEHIVRAQPLLDSYCRCGHIDQIRERGTVLCDVVGPKNWQVAWSWGRHGLIRRVGNATNLLSQVRDAAAFDPHPTIPANSRIPR